MALVATENLKMSPLLVKVIILQALCHTRLGLVNDYRKLENLALKGLNNYSGISPKHIHWIASK